MPCCGSGVETTVAMQSTEEPAASKASATTAAAAEKPKPAKATAPSSNPVQEAAPPAAAPAPAPVPAPVDRSSPAPAPAPAAGPTSTVREEPKPAWANKEKPGTGAAAAVDTPQQQSDATAPGSSTGGSVRPAKNVPTGFVGGTRKDQEVSSGVQDRIQGLKASGLKTNNTGGKRMKTPRIITDTKESWDKEGNITREITRYITEPSGEKRTEKETVYIPAGEVEQQ
eukprot:CAMPEP_0113482964 /NCGR_PEP_ID=MMETSP0014_2-20120614/23190_1 /TAXON_ID=2857 /ORGANISM="Nitzschia sp." /LENGTH=226 /DNA_ID=CAMNT_0000376497 /DNA_START=71 /DNA_END=751 /DNA_ORIENTATION=+ /assembly_acc=CAM_ASM_000159